MTERRYEPTDQQRQQRDVQRRYGQRRESSSRQSGQATEFQSGQRPNQRSSEQGSSQSGWQYQQSTGRTGQRMAQQQGSQTGRTGGGQQLQPPQQPQWEALRPVTIGEIAATDVVTARPDTPVTELVGKMARESVGSIVIVQQNRPVGIVTDRSIALKLEDNPDVSRLRAGDVMSEDLFTVREDENIFEVTRNLGDRGVRRAPVVDDQGTLRGIVSLDDITVLLTEEFENVSRIIEAQSPRY
ncbi:MULTISPECIES: CBS domain-containing protein [Halorussus]|uniref:CBS domain-containing protein n=1 Tax=Halorussus TaxID=1070314 RepID=UPI0020A0D3EE|nr:CBS domain-containing protein [Halorussus vallis]USZ75073.1 CBS domain-containing protein [Halorussus vallis]